MKRITSFETYAATYEFLGELYDTLHNDTLGAVLESMRLVRQTKLPTNPQLKEFWLETVRMSKVDGMDLTIQEGFELMQEFLRRVGLQVHAPGWSEVVSLVALNEHNPELLRSWEESVERAGKYEEWN